MAGLPHLSERPCPQFCQLALRENDYARTPIRPCMDAEPGYEDMADDIRHLDGGYLDDWDARKALYWALFAGAHGHTYGCNPVWQMWTPGANR